MKVSSLRQSILGTLAYSSVFQYPLTESEIFARLIRFQTAKVTRHAVYAAIKSLTTIATSESLLCFFGHEQDRQTRRTRMRWSKHLWKTEIPHLQRVFRRIPWVVAVYVTGSLAMDNVNAPDDDVDVLVVTKKGTLWCVRALVILQTVLLGKYRRHVSDHGGWCFNLWLTTDALTVPKSQQSLYTAYEVLQARHILGQDVLLSTNTWVSEYLQTVSPVVVEVKTTAHVSWVISFFDHVCYVFQRWYMHKRRTRERVGRNFAYFHPRDTQAVVDQSLRTLYRHVLQLEERV